MSCLIVKGAPARAHRVVRDSDEHCSFGPFIHHRGRMLPTSPQCLWVVVHRFSSWRSELLLEIACHEGESKPAISCFASDAYERKRVDPAQLRHQCCCQWLPKMHHSQTVGPLDHQAGGLTFFAPTAEDQVF